MRERAWRKSLSSSGMRGWPPRSSTPRPIAAGWRGWPARGQRKRVRDERDATRPDRQLPADPPVPGLQAGRGRAPADQLRQLRGRTRGRYGECRSRGRLSDRGGGCLTAIPRAAPVHLSAIRCFARWASHLDDTVQVPPARLLPARPTRAAPWIYTSGQVSALLREATALRPTFRAATYRTLVGLIAATGRAAIGLYFFELSFQFNNPP